MTTSRVSIRWNNDPNEDYVRDYVFKTKEELSAFLQGLAVTHAQIGLRSPRDLHEIMITKEGKSGD